ncbi:MAG: hypothetical protein ABR551_07335 [Gemmatimonadales bacterium]
MLATLAAACAVPLDPCAPETSVAGSWQYAGFQDAPVSAELSGTLEVTSESCEGFQGQLDVVEVDGLGATRRLAGPVSGRVLSPTSLRFDAFLAGVARQHIASLGPQTAGGTWVVVSAGAESARTGSFTAFRGLAP